VLAAGFVLTATLAGCLGWVTQASSSDGSALTAISCPTSSSCFAVGRDESSNALVRQSIDGGNTWKTDALSGAGFTLTGVSCADARHCVAVGQSSQAVVTTDGGSQWTTYDNVAGSDLLSVACPEANSCWATAETGSGAVGPLLHSADGGATWTAQQWAPPESLDGQLSHAVLQAISCPSTETCIALGTAVYLSTIYGTLPDVTIGYEPHEISVLATTNDGGTTWQVEVPSAAFTPALSCPTTTSCVAGGSGTSYTITSSDQGADWSVTAGSNGAPGNNPFTIDGISCVTTMRCVAVNSLTPAQVDAKYPTQVESTSDGGQTWALQATDQPNASLHAVACATATNCWAVGELLPQAGISGALIVHTLTGGVSSPLVTAVSPSQGPASGGDLISITGSGFENGVTGVTFGPGQRTTQFTVESDTELTVTTPAFVQPTPTGPAPGGSTATVDVQVSTTLGTSPLVQGDQFTFTNVPPVPVPDGIGADTSAAPTASVTITPGATGDLLVAMIATFNGATVRVSGGGLTWSTALDQADTVTGDGGRISVWTARNTADAVVPVTVTSAISNNGSWAQTLQVEAFRHAVGIGATAFASGTPGGQAPNVLITPWETGSWIALAGFDPDSTTTVASLPPPWPVSLGLDGSYSDTVEQSQMWFQHVTVGPSGGGTVVAGDTLSPEGHWDLAAVEIIAY